MSDFGFRYPELPPNDLVLANGLLAWYDYVTDTTYRVTIGSLLAGATNPDIVWNPDFEYEEGQVVSYNGKLWIATSEPDNLGQPPSDVSIFWDEEPDPPAIAGGWPFTGVGTLIGDMAIVSETENSYRINFGLDESGTPNDLGIREFNVLAGTYGGGTGIHSRIRQDDDGFRFNVANGSVNNQVYLDETLFAVGFPIPGSFVDDEYYSYLEVVHDPTMSAGGPRFFHHIKYEVTGDPLRKETYILANTTSTVFGAGENDPLDFEIFEGAGINIDKDAMNVNWSQGWNGGIIQEKFLKFHPGTNSLQLRHRLVDPITPANDYDHYVLIDDAGLHLSGVIDFEDITPAAVGGDTPTHTAIIQIGGTDYKFFVKPA